MSRSIVAILLVAAGCGGTAPAAPAAPAVSQQSLTAACPAGARVDNLRRALVAGDIYHYQADLHVGTTANAVLRLHRVVRERAPWVPRASPDAVMMLHGDFSTFSSNFLPALAPYLAARDLDVWGVDRRWTHAPADDPDAGRFADTSDFADMSFAQELDDTGTALAFARAVRAAGGSGDDRLTLAGFSRGAQLAYAYAAREGARPRAQRHVKALVPLDAYAAPAPDDAFGRDFACASADFEEQALADGVYDSDNSIFVLFGNLALAAPDDPSPINPNVTNRQIFLNVVAKTYNVFSPTPRYHLLAGVFAADGTVSGLADTPEAAGERWFADAAPHQSMREVAESDAIWCGRAPAIDLSRIDVPLYYLGAAGGFGAAGLDSTTRVRSREVTRVIVQRFPADRVLEDFGHADLLFGSDAPALAWSALATWIAGR